MPKPLKLIVLSSLRRPKTSEGEVEEIFKQLDKNGPGPRV